MSMVAAGAVHLARQTLRPLHEPIWTKTLEFYSTYLECELVEVVTQLHDLLGRFHNFGLHTCALTAKYKTETFHSVSVMTVSSRSSLRFNSAGRT